MKTLVEPFMSATGHGIFLSDDNLLFIGSKCCNYPMRRSPTIPGKDDGTIAYVCMKDENVFWGWYDSAVNLGRRSSSDSEWALSGWARSWTGIEGIEVKIDYM
jgi:hypothetical protein